MNRVILGSLDSSCSSVVPSERDHQLVIFGGISDLPSGKHTKSYGKSPFLMGKSTINGHFQ